MAARRAMRSPQIRPGGGQVGVLPPSKCPREEFFVGAESCSARDGRRFSKSVAHARAIPAGRRGWADSRRTGFSPRPRAEQDSAPTTAPAPLLPLFRRRLECQLRWATELNNRRHVYRTIPEERAGGGRSKKTARAYRRTSAIKASTSARRAPVSLRANSLHAGVARFSKSAASSAASASRR